MGEPALQRTQKNDCNVAPSLQIVCMPHRLSKSRYTAGVQCHKLLWWKVHEPLAVELQPDKVLQDRFDQGAQVGALARGRFPGGVLIDLPHQAIDERVALTRKVIDEGAPAIFEASFLADVAQASAITWR